MKPKLINARIKLGLDGSFCYLRENGLLVKLKHSYKKNKKTIIFKCLKSNIVTDYLYIFKNMKISRERLKALRVKVCEMKTVFFKLRK